MLGGRWADEAEAAQDAHLATLSGRKNATVGMDGGSDQPPPDTAAETDAVDVVPSASASQAAARVSIDEQRVERVRQAAKAAGIQLKVSPEEVAATHSAAAAASGDVETTMTCARLLIRTGLDSDYQSMRIFWHDCVEIPNTRPEDPQAELSLINSIADEHQAKIARCQKPNDFKWFIGLKWEAWRSHRVDSQLRNRMRNAD